MLVALVLAGLMRVGMSDAPLREWESGDASRNVRQRTEEANPKIATRVQSYKNYVRATPSPPAPPTVLPTDAPALYHWKAVAPPGSGFPNLDKIASFTDSWTGVMLYPTEIHRLRELVRNLATDPQRFHRHPAKGALLARIASSNEYEILKVRADRLRGRVINSLEGVWLEVCVLLMQALHIVESEILGIHSDVTGWGYDLIRFGIEQTRTQALPPSFSPDERVNMVKQLAGASLINRQLHPANWTSMQAALEDLRLNASPPSGRVIGSRMFMRHAAAIVKVFGQHAWEKLSSVLAVTGIKKALEDESSPRYEEYWIEADDTVGLAQRFAAIGPEGIDELVVNYFPLGLERSVWEYSDSSRTTIRPRRIVETRQKKAVEWAKRVLRACGRVIGGALLNNHVVGLKLSPASLALLQTPGVVDLELVADREDPELARTIEASPRAKLTDSEALAGSAATDDLVRGEKIDRIVLRIEDEMAFVRHGILEVLGLQGILDILTPAELEGAIRGIDTLTPKIVLNGTIFYVAKAEHRLIREWFDKAVGAMTSAECTRLLQFVTATSHPPIDHAHSRWMSVEVNGTLPVDSDCYSHEYGWLVLPQYTSQAALEANLLSVIRAAAEEGDS